MVIWQRNPILMKCNTQDVISVSCMQALSLWDTYHYHEIGQVGFQCSSWIIEKDFLPTELFGISG